MTAPRPGLDLSLLPDGGVRWLDASGPHSDVVISTRIRLARNVSGYAFTGRAREGERLRMLAQVRDALGAVPALSGSLLLRLDDLPLVDRQLLHERHLVSKELAGLDAQHPVRGGAAVFVGESVGLLVNEEDHLRLQALRSGFAVPQAFEGVSRLDRELGAQVPYAFHREFGFLTACPTNAGTGLRASVLIHLPGLVLTKEIGKVLAGLQQMGLTYRGLYGEGSEVVGNCFQLSNQTTLGRSEEELQEQLSRTENFALTVIGMEEQRAIEAIEAEGMIARVIARDGEYFIVTEDFVYSRINLVVESGFVIEATAG